MSVNEIEAEQGYAVTITGPELTEVSFKRGTGETRHVGNGSFSLGFARFHERHVGVELGVSFGNEETGFELSVAYRIGFLIRGSIEPDALETNIRSLASRVGPTTLYPFVRELVLSLTQRAGMASMLPLVDWEQHVDPDTLDVPEPSGPVPSEMLSL